MMKCTLANTNTAPETVPRISLLYLFKFNWFARHLDSMCGVLRVWHKHC